MPKSTLSLYLSRLLLCYWAAHTLPNVLRMSRCSWISLRSDQVKVGAACAAGLVGEGSVDVWGQPRGLVPVHTVLSAKAPKAGTCLFSSLHSTVGRHARLDKLWGMRGAVVCAVCVTVPQGSSITRLLAHDILESGAMNSQGTSGNCRQQPRHQLLSTY